MRRRPFFAIIAGSSAALLAFGAMAGVAKADTAIGVTVVNVSQSTPSGDVLSQNETPIAINPVNPLNMITGANDWNYNDGCAVNTSFDGGATWSATLPDGFLPGVTKYTNDPNVPGFGYAPADGSLGVRSIPGPASGLAFGETGRAFSADPRGAFYVAAEDGR